MPTASTTQEDYRKRLNQVFDYMDRHLDQEMVLADVAEVAAFSPYHFHRIFKAITGETLLQYITRRRIEKSAADLIHKPWSITEIALKYGYADNAAFTRTFKKFYQISPSEFRNQNPHHFSKIRQLKSKNGQAYPDLEKYICELENLKKWITMNAKIEIKNFPERELAYVSHFGDHNVASAFQKLIAWAGQKGLMTPDAKLLTQYHDSFKVTHPDKVRLSACIVLNEPIEVEGEIGRSQLPGGKHIVGRFEIGLEQYEASWTSLFLWMNENGYEKSDQNPFEIYHNNFQEHPEKKSIVDFCIPII
ncbi:AraC family transcriptional regulator [bacterium SCSIO 12741]|nr:AraC family transcriptional regulator [bacterium SCSIO 12741]